MRIMREPEWNRIEKYTTIKNSDSNTNDYFTCKYVIINKIKNNYNNAPRMTKSRELSVQLIAFPIYIFAVWVHWRLVDKLWAGI